MRGVRARSSQSLSDTEPQRSFLPEPVFLGLASSPPPEESWPFFFVSVYTVQVRATEHRARLSTWRQEFPREGTRQKGLEVDLECSATSAGYPSTLLTPARSCRSPCHPMQNPKPDIQSVLVDTSARLTGRRLARCPSAQGRTVTNANRMRLHRHGRQQIIALNFALSDIRYHLAAL